MIIANVAEARLWSANTNSDRPIELSCDNWTHDYVIYLRYPASRPLTRLPQTGQFDWKQRTVWRICRQSTYTWYVQKNSFWLGHREISVNLRTVQMHL